MNTIFLNFQPPNIENTILLILPSNNKYQINTPYALVNFFSNELLATKTLISKETCKVSELRDADTYLAKNVDAKLYYQILRNQYKKRLSEHEARRFNEEHGELIYRQNDLYSFITKSTLLDVLVLTDKCHIKKLNEIQPFDIDTKTSLLSNKQIISKDYCQKSKWNFAKQRPYTEDELGILSY